MQRLGLILTTVLIAAPLAAQDTTKAKPAAAPAPAPAAATGTGSLTLEDAVIAKAVADRAPQDTGTTFPADVGQLIFYTRISGGSAGSPAPIHHVWFHGDTQVADVELNVSGSPWRTWSRKTIPADWTGAWHVEVRDASGAVLKRIDFSVGQ